MRRALARCIAALPMAAVVLAACDKPVTTVPATEHRAPVQVRALIAGMPGLNTFNPWERFQVCSVGGDNTYTFDDATFPDITGFYATPNHGSKTVTAGNCAQLYYSGAIGGAPLVNLVTVTWASAPAGTYLDHITVDALGCDPAIKPCPPATKDVSTPVLTPFAYNVNNDVGIVATFYYLPLPSIQLSKTADAATVAAGQNIGFTLTLTNNGPGTATAPTITDQLPTVPLGGSWSVTSPASGCTINASNLLTCILPDLPATQSTSVHVTSPTVADAAGSDCQAYDNTGTASANFVQPVTSNQATETVACSPRITLAKVADAGTVNAGDPIGFTLTVASVGTGAATNVTVTDPLPAVSGQVWTIASTTPSGANCSITTGTLSCSLGTMASGTSVSVHVTSPTTAADCTTYNNTANATADGLAASASASTAVQCPSLTVVKTADATSVNAGNPVGFTVTVTSGGPGTARGVTLSDPLPGSLTWSVDAANSTAGCSISGASLSCSFGDLAAGASAHVHVTAPTTSAACGVLNNTAAAQSTNGASGQGSASETVVCPPSLSITKTADAASVKAGNPIGFTVTVSSNGPGTATGVTLSDPLPTGTGISWSMSPSNAACSISGNTLSCNFGSMAAGTTQTVHLTSPTMNGSCGTYNNTATMASTNATGGRASASTSVTGCLTVCTATMGGWGQDASGNNIGAMRDAYFKTVYPTSAGVLVGTTSRYIQLKTALAVNNYLPATGGIGVLDKSYVNPTTTPALTFGGQVTALRLNVDFSNAQVNGWKPGLATSVVASGPLAGKTVAQVLSIAQGVLAGGALPSGMTLGDLNVLVSAINGMNSPDGCGFGDGTVKAP